MNFNQLQYFMTVAEHEHMTKAAKALFISQPTLSRTIGLLEKELGFTLFERDKNRIKLNQAGKAFYSLVKKAFDELQNGVYLTNKAYYDSQRMISFSSTRNWLFDSLGMHFLDADPEYMIRATIHSVSNIYSELQNGQLDFAVVLNSVKSNQFTSIPLPEENLLLLTYQHLPYDNNIIPLKDLDSRPFIVDSEQSELWKLLLSSCQKQDATPFIGQVPFSSEALITQIIETGFMFPCLQSSVMQIINQSPPGFIPLFFKTEPPITLNFTFLVNKVLSKNDKSKQIESLLRSFTEKYAQNLGDINKRIF